jgi:hypothetical protein
MRFTTFSREPRIGGSSSLFEAFNPAACLPYFSCPEPRVVDCCKAEEDHDIVECPRCGRQWATRCTFDEDMS